MTTMEREKASSEEMLDFYQKLRKKIREQLDKRKETEQDEEQTPFGKLVELLALLPDMFHLGVKLLLDKNVPAENKGALVAGLAYVISPIDLIPDNIPVAGWIDDLIVIVMAINKLIETEDEAVAAAVERHWAGKDDVFTTIKHILSVADTAVEFLPRKFMKIVKGMFPKR